jgi:hypothetical protein
VPRPVRILHRDLIAWLQRAGRARRVSHSSAVNSPAMRRSMATARSSGASSAERYGLAYDPPTGDAARRVVLVMRPAHVTFR